MRVSDSQQRGADAALKDNVKMRPVRTHSKSELQRILLLLHQAPGQGSSTKFNEVKPLRFDCHIQLLFLFWAHSCKGARKAIGV